MQKSYYTSMEITIKVPTDINEVTLGQYQKFLKIQKENTDDTFVAQKMIEIFCNVELKHVISMRWTDVQDIVSSLSDLFETKAKFRETFTLDSVQYGFIPNLDEISFGEFVDLDNYLKDWDDMDKAMSVMYRPIDIMVRGKYNIKKYEGKVNEHMKDMPLGLALGAVFFLLNLGKELSQVILDYLDRGVLKDTQLKEDLNKSGVSTVAFTRQLKEILQNLNISQKWEFTKF